MGVDYKFLNFEVKIEKVLKLHGLKMHFFLIFKSVYMDKCVYMIYF